MTGLAPFASLANLPGPEPEKLRARLSFSSSPLPNDVI